MAQTRLERIGTIFSRVTSLIRGGAMKEEDKPLWYVIYQAFPPKEEPRFDRPEPNIRIRPIFYKEDVIRARFQKENNRFLACSLVNTRTKSRTQRFISIYQELEKDGVPEEELYAKAMEAYVAQNESFKNQISENVERNKNAEKEHVEANVDLKKVFDM